MRTANVTRRLSEVQSETVSQTKGEVRMNKPTFNPWLCVLFAFGAVVVWTIARLTIQAI